MMVFGGRSSMELAAKVAGKLSLDLGQVTLKTFANGEVYCRYEESIRGADVFLVQSTCGNEQSEMTPNDALVELLTMIDAAQGASAHRIIAVLPWYGYARQDKKSAPREPVSARLVAKCDDPGRDRLPRGRLLVLAGVAVPGQHGDDPVRRGALGGVDHRQQLDQGVVRGHLALLVGAGRLHDEDIGAADRLLVAAVDLAVGAVSYTHLTL